MGFFAVGDELEMRNHSALCKMQITVRITGCVTRVGILLCARQTTVALALLLI